MTFLDARNSFAGIMPLLDQRVLVEGEAINKMYMHHLGKELEISNRRLVSAYEISPLSLQF